MIDHAEVVRNNYRQEGAKAERLKIIKALADKNIASDLSFFARQLSETYPKSVVENSLRRIDELLGFIK